MLEPTPAEAIIEPELQIVDAHHHLWLLPEAMLGAVETQNSLSARLLAPTYRSHSRYLFDEFSADLSTGHHVRASVFADCHSMYRSSGPDSMKSVGEVEFANGVGAMAASGIFGAVKVCAGIVGGIDLRLGDGVEEVLRAQIQAGGARYRGVRGAAIIHDDDERILGAGASTPNVLLDPSFRVGFKWLNQLGLSFDVLVLEPQLPELIDLARAFPDTQIILNHMGVPVGIGRYAGQREARFSIWREHILTLSRCPNVAVKLGGIGLPFAGFNFHRSTQSAASLQLAEQWRPYIDTCIESFGVNRCMFVSNFPVDSAACTYRTLWNVFKRVTAGASNDEKNALFSGTATRIYRLES